MINTVLFGVNIILLMLIWKFILRPSILDHYRDMLFDLREEARDFYISKNISLDDSTYKNLRDLLNTHLRFTEKMSLTKTAYFSNKIEKNIDLRNSIKYAIDNKFKTSDERLSQFIKITRLKSTRILFKYMILSSPLLLLLFIVVLCAYIPVHICKKNIILN